MERKNNLPNLIIGGVHKAGTTSLHTYLSMHPQVCGSLIKELAFLLPARYNEEVASNDEYATHFKHYANEKYVLETTPSYLYGGISLINKIEERLGNDVKIIFILREPTDRFISFYRHCVTKLEIPADTTLQQFVEMSSSIENGIRQSNETDHITQGLIEGDYASFLPIWMEHFKDRLLIIFFDELSNDTSGVMKKVCKWLEIDFKFFKKEDFTIENRTADYKIAFVHKFALWFNHHTETFWRKHYKLKRFIRGLYYGINEKKSDANNKGDEVVITRLKKTYDGPNERLASMLKNFPNINLPFWLQR
ncbi:MAG: sulfotransferase family protein [Bacteroidota bacterium]|jgi:hypothetical protein